MNESNSIETIHKTNLTEQRKIRLDKITEIEKYFYQEIEQRKSCSKKLSKYVAAFDYIDKILIVLSAKTGGVSICSFTRVIEPPVGIASASFTLLFSLTTEIFEKLLSITRHKKKTHDKIFMLAKSKLNSIETLISQALIHMEISHEENIAIVKEKELRSENENQKIMRLSSINQRLK